MHTQATRAVRRALSTALAEPPLEATPKRICLSCESRPVEPALKRICQTCESRPLEREEAAQSAAPDLMRRRSFYQRELPPNLTGFSSPEGKARFLEAAASGTAEGAPAP